MADRVLTPRTFKIATNLAEILTGVNLQNLQPPGSYTENAQDAIDILASCLRGLPKPPTDWASLRASVAGLGVVGLDIWLDPPAVILHVFPDARRGLDQDGLVFSVSPGKGRAYNSGFNEKTMDFIGRILADPQVTLRGGCHVGCPRVWRHGEWVDVRDGCSAAYPN